MSDKTLSGKAAQYSNFYVNSTGVYYKKDKGNDVFVCGPLRILAMTRDENQQNFGKLLEWTDADGHVHQWAMPSDFLAASDGRDILKVLLNGGFMDIKNKKYLKEYLADYPIEARALCVTKTGWHGSAFVLPDKVIGQPNNEHLILQDGGTNQNIYMERDCLENWRKEVSQYCVNNSRLMFAVSAAFAASLMNWANIEGAGFNFKGNSSEGKTTALRMAASVCGGKDYMISWRATSNGLEGVAALHNDSPLVLDEMAQVEPKEAGNIAYMLANGMGKIRANRSGMARPKKEWRTLLLSSGEISLSEHLASIGKKAKAGQEVRLIDIPMDTGVHGGFECLHGHEGGANLADHLKETCSQYYGVAFRAFLEAINGKEDEMTELIKQIRTDFIKSYVPEDGESQAQRIASYFALVAAGGEAATQAGITGWETGEALKAVSTCFTAWLDDRGGAGNSEDKTILENIISFIQLHGQSRFAQWEKVGEFPERVIDRVGYIRKVENETQYYIFRQAFREEICKGVSHKRALTLLDEKGLLVREGGKNTISRKPPDQSEQVRFYCIKGSVLDG